MQTTRIHWPSILVLTVIGLGIPVFLTASLVIGVSSLAELFDEYTDPAGKMISSFAIGFEILVLLASAWFVLQKSMQKEQADLNLRFPFSLWQIFAFPAVVLFCLSIGAVVSISGVKILAWLILPVLTVISITLPILLFLGIGTNGIEFGPRWKAWGALGISMTLSPLLMITFEIVGLFTFALVGVIALSAQPDLVQELGEVGQLLIDGVSDEAAMQLLAPYIATPAVIASVFLYLSLLVPLIEELLKPLAVWLFAMKLDSPSHGFALGMLSGGAFALVESLNASSDGTGSWFVIVGVRAGTSLLHMTTSGLMGYAIVQLLREKKILRFIGTYAAAVLLHGLWNACAAGTALAALGETIGRPEWLWNLPAALCGITVLGGGMLVVLLAANRKVRAVPASLTAPEPSVNEEGVK